MTTRCKLSHRPYRKLLIRRVMDRAQYNKYKGKW